MEVLWQIGDDYMDLTEPIRVAARAPRGVVWMSVSTTVQIFFVVGHVFSRARFGPAVNRHTFDGSPVLVEAPFVATSCGCWDASGYASSEPVLVAQVDDPDEVTRAVQHGRALLRELVESGATVVPVAPGHSPDPCGALHCPKGPVEDELGGELQDA